MLVLAIWTKALLVLYRNIDRPLARLFFKGVRLCFGLRSIEKPLPMVLHGSLKET
jgi:hypothetical protein